MTFGDHFEIVGTEDGGILLGCLICGVHQWRTNSQWGSMAEVIEQARLHRLGCFEESA